MNDKENFYITTTLPYVNAKPHIGFALEIIQADVIARYNRNLGRSVIFNTGTDEHGKKIYEKAVEAGKEPQEYADEYAEKFDALKNALNLTYDHFIRTTDEKHIRAAQKFWNICSENGDIYKKNYKTKYCVGCELEITDSELLDGKCGTHPNREIEHKNEENYFFKFSRYQDKLIELYESNPNFVVPSNRLLEIKNFVESGLQDFSISRLKKKMPWGIEVPGDSDHVMYVWFDALINYISTLDWQDDGKEFNEYWPGVQVAGKDNLRQQSAMWQAMLMSAGLPTSKQVFIHGFITSEGRKMSKSLGNVVDPYQIVENYGADAVRYYLLREMPSHADGDYSEKRMNERYSELANQLGNLVGRVASMSNSYFQGNLDQVHIDFSLKKKQLKDDMTNYDFKKYVDHIFESISDANETIEKTKPFKLVKEDENAAKKVLSELAENIRFIADALLPIIPETAEEILRRYGKLILVGDPLFPKKD